MRTSAAIAAILFLAATLPAHADLPFTLSKETTYITAPLHPDGTPDYVAALNERLGKGVTPDTNGFAAFIRLQGVSSLYTTAHADESRAAAAKMLQLAGTTPILDPTPFQSYFAFYKNRPVAEVDEEFQVLIGLPRRLWRDQDFAPQAAHLKAMDAILDQARDAFERPAWWTPYITTDGRSMAHRVDPLNSIGNEIFYDLAARATLKAQSGDFESFLRDAIAVKRVGRLASAGTLFDRLQSLALQRRGNDALASLLASGTLTAAQCDKISAAMDDLDKLAPFPSFENDVSIRWMILDDLILAATGKADLLKVAQPDHEVDAFEDFDYVRYRMLSTIDTLRVDWDAVLKTVNTLMDQSNAARQADSRTAAGYRSAALMTLLEPWQGQADNRAGFAPGPGETKAAYSNRIAMGYVAFHVGEPAPWEDIRFISLQQEQLTRTLVAAAKCRAVTGTWPGKLDDLVPAYLPKSPSDLFSQDIPEPIHYVQHPDATILLYSIGGNQKDDNAKRDDILAGIRPPPIK